MNIQKNKIFMVRIIEFTCTCPAVCRPQLFPCRNRLLIIMYFPTDSQNISGCQVFPKVGSRGGPDCKKLCFWVDCQVLKILQEVVLHFAHKSMYMYILSITHSVVHCVHDKTVQQFSYVPNHQGFGRQAFLRLHKKALPF